MSSAVARSVGKKCDQGCDTFSSYGTVFIRFPTTIHLRRGLHSLYFILPTSCRYKNEKKNKKVCTIVSFSISPLGTSRYQRVPTGTSGYQLGMAMRMQKMRIHADDALIYKANKRMRMAQMRCGWCASPKTAAWPSLLPITLEIPPSLCPLMSTITL